MKPATELIRPGVVSRDAAPLTTPIYETTTFVFENAAEVRGVQRGQVDEVPLLALRQPDGGGRRADDRRARRRRGGAAAVERAGGDDDRAAGAAARRATRSSAARRSTAARCTCSRDLLAKFGITARFVVARGAGAAGGADLPSATRLVWFESPINPTLRCVDIAAVARGLPRARRHLGHRQHVREPDQPAAARARRRSRDAQRDEVPQRPQRRDRRRAGRAVAR